MSRNDKSRGVKAWTRVFALGFLMLASFAAEAGFTQHMTISSGGRRQKLENGYVYLI